MSSSDHNADFRMLGLSPTEDWLEVKSAYRKLVLKWHPDRYTDSATEKKKAEEKLKEINQAYSRLSSYYKKHSRLPPEKKKPSSHVPENRQDNRKPQTYKDHAKPKPKTKPDQPEIYSRKPEVINQPRKSGKILFIVIVAVSLYLILRDDDREMLPQTNKSPGTTERISNQPLAQIPRPPLKKVRYFTYGSTLGEVHSVQGEPTKIEGDIWYYGKSEVKFKKGRVVSWLMNPDTPLWASATKPSIKKFFSFGATTSDVLEIQGPPSRMTPNLWEYGASKVYFKDGRVIRWYNSPLDSLNVKN